VASLEEHIRDNGLAHERDALLLRTSEFIEQTFRIAQPNLRVNGQNFESVNQDEQNMEPFDEALDRHIWALASTRLQWQKRIAETRRKLPSEMEATMLELLEEQRKAEAEEATAVLNDVVIDHEEDIEQLPRHPHISKGLQVALALGEELDQMIPAQEERADRIKSVAMEVQVFKS